MSLDQTETAVEALLLLNREFPHDPDVLFTTTHFYSELASRAAQDLAATAPTSHQAEQLEAEAFESQGNWDKAIAQYKKIIEQEPETVWHSLSPRAHLSVAVARRTPRMQEVNLQKN